MKKMLLIVSLVLGFSIQAHAGALMCQPIDSYYNLAKFAGKCNSKLAANPRKHKTVFRGDANCKYVLGHQDSILITIQKLPESVISHCVLRNYLKFDKSSSTMALFARNERGVLNYERHI